MNKFEPIDHNYVHKVFNDRRITDKMGVPNSPERGGDYGYKPKPKRGPHDPDTYKGPREGGWGGVKPKPKGPKPSLPPAEKRTLKKTVQ